MRLLWLGTVAAVLLGGCGGSSTPAHIRVTSPAFPSGGPIPSRFTCQGQDISPPLRWTGMPPSTTTISLVMRDPDAPGGNFIHWRLSGIPGSTRALLAGALPPGVKAGRNDFGTFGYRGPCPPPGAAHHYVITVTARSRGTVVATGTLIGTYTRR